MVPDATQLATAYQAVFESEAGRVVLLDLLHAGGVLTDAHTPGDSHTTAYNDGRAALARYILRRLNWSAMELVQLGERLTAEQLRERDDMMENEDSFA